MDAPLILIEDLVKFYRTRRRDVRAVDGVSFSARRGEIVGLLGANGAGKTTTIKCASTLIIPTSGRIVIDGIDAIRSPRRAVKKIATVLEGTRNIYWRLTTKENLEFFAELQGMFGRRLRPQIDSLLERFTLADKRDTPARMLSKGMQQKLALACTLIKGTPVLMLDEPTLGLDPRASHDFRRLVRELATDDGRTIIFSSHDMASVESVCDRVVILHEGHVVADDTVANLVQLFRARAYTFAISGQLRRDQHESLTALFPLIEINSGEDTTTLDVELRDASGLYRLLDVLRDGECVVESMQRRDPNLEQIFLKVLDQAGRQ